MIISCHKTLEKGIKLSHSLDEANIANKIIVGGQALDNYPKDNIVVVDAPDNYESLPIKVSRAINYLYENFGKIPIFKTDDNNCIDDVDKLHLQIESCLNENQYAGSVVGGLNHDRCWHFGKCEDERINHLPYGKPYYGDWATGNFYFLPAEAVEALAINVIRFPALHEGELYEDKFIGDQLRQLGFNLMSIQFDDSGLKLDDRHHFYE
jgi:hypothetical protein